MKSITVLSSFAITLLFPKLLFAQERDSYSIILPLMLEVACYRHKGVSDEDINSFLLGAMEVARISPEQFRSTVASDYWRANWAKEGAKILVRKGGCEQIWQEWLNYTRAFDEPKPNLHEDDSSRPFAF